MLKTISKKLAFLPILFLMFGSLYISPVKAAASFGISGSRSLTAGQTFSVTISVSRNTTYNAVSVNVSANNLTILSASATGGWTAISGPSRSASSASFSGALLGQNITGSRNVLILSVRAPSSTGSASLTVSGQVSGEGSGTGTENGSGSASYTIKAAPTAAPTPKPAAGAVTVASSTHPDQNKWYNSNSPAFSWNKDGGVLGFSYSFDNSPSTDPDTTSEGAASTTAFSNQENGVFYFHIKAQNDIGWGPASHFKVNIDNLAPEPFTITTIKDESTNEYRVYFATNDKNSGIASYTVDVDGQSLGVKSSDFTLPLSTREIKVTAADSAGNVKESILKFSEAGALIAPTIQNTSNNNSSNQQQSTNPSTNSTNLWLIVLAIISSLLLIYAITMTALHLKDKGHFNKIAKKPGDKKDATKSKVELNPSSDFGVEKSPLK